ncbi:MAG: SRPBCC family protein [Bacteroidia bacterium]
MKALKVILGIIVAIIAVFVVLGVMAPKEEIVERSIVIDAPADIVWKNISSLEAQLEWSPWAKRDPEIKNSFEGQPGTVGSKYTWSGNEDVGSGYQSIALIDEGKRMQQDLTFTGDFESHADVWIDILAEGESQNVTWGFKTEFDFVGSVFMLMQDLEAMLGADYEEGLGYLKEICKKQAELNNADDNVGESFEINGQLVVEKSFGPKTYIAVREEVKFEDLPKFFETNYGKIMQKVLGAGYEMDGMPSAIYFVWDEENMKADVAAAIPLKGMEIEIEGFESITVGSGLACQIEFMGSYDSLKTPHMALEKHFENKDYPFSMAIEEYVTDPTTVETESEIKTLITYPVVLEQ